MTMRRPPRSSGTSLSAFKLSPSTHAVANLHLRLDNLVFDENKSFEEHFSKFLTLFDELSSLDQHMTKQEKVTKLIRSPPPSFDVLAMALSVNETTFENLISAVQVKIERRKKLRSSSQTCPSNQAYMVSNEPSFQPNQSNNKSGFNGRGGYSGSGRDGRGGRGGRRGFRARGGRIGKYRENRTCHYCGMPGHFIKFFRKSIAEEEFGRNPRPNKNGAGNSQGHGNVNHNDQ